MKKLLGLMVAIAMVAGMSTYVMAADWNLYGSGRVGIYSADCEATTENGTVDVEEDDRDTTFDLQGNSRVGAHIDVSEDMRARMELGMADSDGDVYARLLYGELDFGAGKVLVGQDYTPFYISYSNQAFAYLSKFDITDASLHFFNVDSYDKDTGEMKVSFYDVEKQTDAFNAKKSHDNGLLGPAPYGGRKPQIKLTRDIEGGMLQLAIIQPTAKNIKIANKYTSYNSGDGVDLNGRDTTFPKIEAGAIYAVNDSFGLRASFGWNQYDAVNKADDEYAVTTFVAGAGAKFVADRLTVAGTIAYSLNPFEGGYTTDSQLRTMYNDQENDIVDYTTTSGTLVVNMQVNDLLKVELGTALTKGKHDDQEIKSDEIFQLYLQSPFRLADGFVVTPEVGIMNYSLDRANNSNVEIDTFYFGTKWQIDF